jgi:hypothetical protein
VSSLKNLSRITGLPFFLPSDFLAFTCNLSFLFVLIALMYCHLFLHISGKCFLFIISLILSEPIVIHQVRTVLSSSCLFVTVFLFSKSVPYIFTVLSGLLIAFLLNIDALYVKCFMSVTSVSFSFNSSSISPFLSLFISSFLSQCAIIYFSLSFDSLCRIINSYCVFNSFL